MGRTVVPIDLDQVSEWFFSNSPAGQRVEILDRVDTGRKFKPSKKGLKAHEKVYEGFLQGHSMVINNLHLWSEPAMRMARDLYEAVDLPVDVYMYLTPPHSSSYRIHSDVMDAWMVQLAGSKEWMLCNERNFDMKDDWVPPTCQNITTQGGDVTYIPFHTMHQVKTGDQLSAHLTVNVERQYFVWATLMIAVAHKTANPQTTMAKLIQSENYGLEGRNNLEKFFQKLQLSVPGLSRVPLGEQEPKMATKWLVRSLSEEDLPNDYVARVLDEYRALLEQSAKVLASNKKLAQKKMKVGKETVTGAQLLEELSQEGAAQAIPWVLELARHFCVTHFGADDKNRVQPPPEIFNSLASLRKIQDVAKAVKPGVKVHDLLTPETVLSRAPRVRIVLLLQEGKKDKDTLKLQFNGQLLQFPSTTSDLLHFSLSLFREGTSQGQPFLARDVPGGFDSAKSVLSELITAGALQVS